MNLSSSLSGLVVPVLATDCVLLDGVGGAGGQQHVAKNLYWWGRSDYGTENVTKGVKCGIRRGLMERHRLLHRGPGQSG